ncbi:MAG: UDP-N-acetylglucosamine pyrophosphorylase [Oscillospiraceae bacterium]|jgi:NDP-sugar pyrophosphorylase family protein|nr:UDP-N-acetylglucosamine pyrophosphorylase [Oscillospiraceae bacterium]
MINDLLSQNLFDLSKTIAEPLINKYDYPWEVLTEIKNYILEIGKTLSSSEYEKKGENIWISKNAHIALSSYISGPAIIQEGVEIRHCAYIRGNVIVGKHSVVGNSTEIKNSILFEETQAPHYNYVGDSILGYKSHLGAGSIMSNIKSDKTNIDIKSGKEKIKTNLRKIGAMIGDHSEIGCNAVMNPGTILGKNCCIYPLTMVRGYIEPNHIVKNNGEIIKKY